MHTMKFYWSYDKALYTPARKNTIPMMRPTNTNGPKVEDMQHYSGSGKRLGGIQGLVLLYIVHACIMLMVVLVSHYIPCS